MLARLKQWAAALKREVITLWMCCRHPEMPLLPKLLAILVVGYAFSPVDLIPDFIPVLGLLDELILLPLAVHLALKLVPGPVIEDSRDAACHWLASRAARPRNWWAAGFFILIWLALAVGALHLLGLIPAQR